jgi:hypothetical protein
MGFSKLPIINMESHIKFHGSLNHQAVTMGIIGIQEGMIARNHKKYPGFRV